jgi:uncharacterized hydrophobic protein (TIGR00271 family)
MDALTASIRPRIARALLGVEQHSTPAVYLGMFDASEVVNLKYGLELLLSAGIATLGLVLDSPAVVIGAMLISPLMGPILAAGLALAAADLYLGIKSLLSIVFGVLLSVLFAAALVWLLPFQSPTGEILARIHPNLLDLGVALFSGLAGAIVVCRGASGAGITALPGVAIAVALMPPLCTVGFGIGSGFSRAIIYGAGLLFLTNLAAIVASAFLVFYLARMDAPEVRAEIDAAILERAPADRLFQLLKKVGMSGAFGDIGKLRWRVLMLVVVLALLFVPLRQSLMQVRDETVARAAVGEALRMLAPPGVIVARQVDPNSDPIVISLVVTSAIPQENVKRAEKLLLRRTGRDARIAIRKVASEEELALLRERFKQPAAPPLIEDLNRVREDVMGRLGGPLKEIWPAGASPLVSYEMGFTPDDTVVRIRYEAAKPLDATAEQVLLNVLKLRLHINNLRLVLEQQPPPRPQRKTARRR